MTLFKSIALLATLLAGIGAGTARADTITTIVAGDPAGFGGFNGAGNNTAAWTPTAGGGYSEPSGFVINSGAGAYGGSGNYAYLSMGTTSYWKYIGLQSLSVTPGDVVTVTVEVLPSAVGDQFGISYGATGSVPPGSGTYYAPIQSITFASAGSYVLETFTFTATSSLIDIDFGFHQYTSGESFSVDNITVTEDTPSGAIPEPASMALLGVALLGLGLARRKFG